MRPSHAESTRTLVATTDRGALSTRLADDGSPYGSLVEYTTLDNGDLLFFLSDLADHTKNLRDDARCSLLISERFAADNPLENERATLVGRMEWVEHTEAFRELYLDAHPHAETYIDFDDFNFFRLRPHKIRYVGGFGRMSWLEGDAYREAQPDPLREAAPGIVEHMNEDHVDAMVQMATRFTDRADTTSARMLRVDRYGFDLEVDGQQGRGRERIAFPEPVDDPGEVRGVMVHLTQKARSENRS
jgi:hypothetical protein